LQFYNNFYLKKKNFCHYKITLGNIQLFCDVNAFNYFFRSKKIGGLRFLGFVYAENNLILCIFLFGEMALT